MLKGKDPKVNGEPSHLGGWRHLKGKEGNWLPRNYLGKKANTNNSMDKRRVEAERRLLTCG